MLLIKILTFSIMFASIIPVKCLNFAYTDGKGDKDLVPSNDIESNKRNDEQLKIIYQNYSRVHRNSDNGVIYGDSSNKCGGTFKSVQTTIQSPGYPDEYQPNSYCEYVFKSPFVCKTEFHIQFLFFSLQSSKDCVKDHLKIGKHETLCGKVIGIMKYKAMDGVLRITFVTDDDIAGNGFNLLVTRLPCSDEESSTVFPIYEKRTIKNDDWDVTDIEFTTSFNEDSATEENEADGQKDTRTTSVNNDIAEPILILQPPIYDHFEEPQNKSYQFSYLGSNGNGYLPPPSTDIPTTHTNCFPDNGGYPSNGGQYPVNGGQFPVNGGQFPVNGGQFPVNGGQFPVIGGHYPVYNGQVPGYNGQFPGYNGQGPGYNGQYPVGQFPSFSVPSNNVPPHNYPSSNYPSFNGYLPPVQPNLPSSNGYLPSNNVPPHNYPSSNYPSFNGHLPPVQPNFPSSNGYLPPSNGYLPQNPNRFPNTPSNYPTFPTNNGYPSNFPTNQPPSADDPNIQEVSSVNTTPIRDVVQSQVFPSAIPQCCTRQFNQQRFYVASSNFPTKNIQNVDCLHYINRNNPSVCRIRIEFKFFSFGNYHPQFGCVDNFIEIDGQRICGCRSGMRYISQWGIGSKIIRVQSRAGVTQGIHGFLLDVIQEQCPYRISRDSSAGRNDTNWDRSDSVLHKAIKQTNSSSLTTYYYYADDSDTVKPKVRLETKAEFDQRAEGPNARFFFPPTRQQNRCTFSNLNWLQLVADPLWLVKPTCRR